MVTRESYTRRVVKDARAWFREHVIDISTMPDEASQNGLMTVVDFHRPDSSMYAVRYIFSGHYVFVSGDLGTAVFNCTWRTGPTDGYWKNTDYVYEKLDAAKENRSERNRWINHFMEFSEMEEIDRRVVMQLIRSIRIISKEELQIEFNYQDEYQKAVRFAEQMEQAKREERRAG